ncbi:hypothetical protein SALBM311S_02872 [Streptomyces alboniger]
MCSTGLRKDFSGKRSRGSGPDPARGGELRGPVDVDVEYVEPAAVAVAQVGGHLRVRLVGGVRELDEGDPLAGMGAVPALKQRAEVAGEVSGGRHGERPPAARGPVLGVRAGGDVPGQDHRENEKAPTGGVNPPHRFLPVHLAPEHLTHAEWRRAPSHESEAMYTC